MKRSRLQPKVSTLQETFVANESVTTFKLFNALPTELLVRIITYAWKDEIQSSQQSLFATSTFSGAPGATSPRIYFQHYKTPRTSNLSTVSKLFRSKCRVLAKSHLIQIPTKNQNKSILFIPDRDILTIHIKGTSICDQTISSSFHALPKQLRNVLKHAKIEYSTYDEMDHILYQLGITGLASMICNMDAPLLEHVTISSRAISRVSWKTWKKGQLQQHRVEVCFRCGIRIFAADDYLL